MVLASTSVLVVEQGLQMAAASICVPRRSSLLPPISLGDSRISKWVLSDHCQCAGIQSV